MSALSELLDEMPEGRVAAVSFSDGDEVWLKNFTLVDESIYDRPDLWCAEIVRVIASKALGSSVGSLLQFSILDVAQVADPDANRVLFSRVSGENQLPKGGAEQ